MTTYLTENAWIRGVTIIRVILLVWSTLGPIRKEMDQVVLLRSQCPHLLKCLIFLGCICQLFSILMKSASLAWWSGASKASCTGDIIKHGGVS